jgi:hypothetical protein
MKDFLTELISEIAMLIEIYKAKRENRERKK